MTTSRICARLKHPGSALLGAALLSGLSLSYVWAAEPSVPERTVRQIGVMEKIIDKVLIDSPNFLVHGGDNARGLYIDEFGAVFTFQASLVGKWFDWKGFMEQLDQRIEMKTDEDGNQIFVLHSAGGGEKDKSKDKTKEVEGKAKEILEGGKTREDAQVYEQGKQEMVQTILDYGETMSSLRDDQWLLLAAHLKGADYFKEMEISRLVLKAKMQDLRDFASGKISESTAKSRVVIEEY